jgi:hypothetical protein
MNAVRRALFLGIAALPGSAGAHGFGARYDLPIPLSLYLTGAALTVAFSFAMLGVALRSPRGGAAISEARGMRLPAVLPAARALGVALYALVVCAGLLGVQSPLKNIAPVFVWALWWVGMAYLSALIGNVWVLVNPFDALFAWGAALSTKWRRAREPELTRPCPAWLGVWPAVILFAAFVWMEMISEASEVPAGVARALLVYSALTWTGMALFGREEWLRRGEAFTLVFGLIARFAPLDIRVDGERVAVRVRPYAVGLLVREPVEPSRVFLVMLLLATVSFDGFLETPAWAALAASTDDEALVKSAGLFVAPLLFLAIFLAVCRLSEFAAAGATSQPRRPTWQVAGSFANTLVPIAIAYQLAHYLSFLASAAQYAIPLASDPLGLGWDLFGTVNHFIHPGWADARIVWNVSVAAIVGGHVAAVYLAHVQALRTFGERSAALRSQYPMLGLMIGYTMLSLWIIAQPIVSTRFS